MCDCRRGAVGRCVVPSTRVPSGQGLIVVGSLKQDTACRRIIHRCCDLPASGGMLQPFSRGHNSSTHTAVQHSRCRPEPRRGATIGPHELPTRRNGCVVCARLTPQRAVRLYGTQHSVTCKIRHSRDTRSRSLDFGQGRSSLFSGRRIKGCRARTQAHRRNGCREQSRRNQALSRCTASIDRAGRRDERAKGAVGLGDLSVCRVQRWSPADVRTHRSDIARANADLPGPARGVLRLLNRGSSATSGVRPQFQACATGVGWITFPPMNKFTTCFIRCRRQVGALTRASCLKIRRDTAESTLNHSSVGPIGDLFPADGRDRLRLGRHDAACARLTSAATGAVSHRDANRRRPRVLRFLHQSCAGAWKRFGPPDSKRRIGWLNP